MLSPLLSIIIPVYNTEKFVSKAIDSVLKQTHTDFELIIIDDGSTDKSTDIILSYNDPRIRYFENRSNFGIVYSRNKGLKLSRGKYIGMVDADDIVHPTKFEKQLKFLQENPEFGMIGSWVKFIDEMDNPLKGSWKLKAKPESIPSLMLFKNYFLQSSVLYRKECFDHLSFTENFDILEDYLLWFQILKKYKGWNLPEYLVKYRIHEQGVTKKYDLERIEKEKRVFKIQLSEMGIEPTEEELKIHLQIRRGEKINSLETLKKTEQWLIKILTQNQKSKTYEQNTLINTIVNRWLKVCRNSNLFNPKILRKCLTSRLLTNFTVNISNTKNRNE